MKKWPACRLSDGSMVWQQADRSWARGASMEAGWDIIADHWCALLCRRTDIGADFEALKEFATPNEVQLIDRITEYLARGGLFNPELMEHKKVADLLADCREAFLDGIERHKRRDRNDAE